MPLVCASEAKNSRQTTVEAGFVFLCKEKINKIQALLRDKLCGNMPLREISIFIFYAISASKEAWVEEVWSGSIERGCWAP